jgi:MoxR-like ATPase
MKNTEKKTTQPEVSNFNNPKIAKILSNLQTNIIGQDDLITNLLIALIAQGHILLEGMPGLAKTLSGETLAKSISTSFKRIQFTPDLLPSDLIGTEIFIQEKAKFEFSQGPIFANIILADEINRSPAKVQSALLEAMAEKQVTIGKKSYKLDDIFLVIATQNPIEQEGTYNLPEAQLDRFLLHVKLDYPDKATERQILEISHQKNIINKLNLTSVNEVKEMQEQAKNIYVDKKIKDYIVDLVIATREIEKLDKNLAKYIKYGVSPRASLALYNASKALAYINNDDYVTPYHIKKVVHNIFRHRLILNYNAYADNISSDDVVDKIINLVAI